VQSNVIVVTTLDEFDGTVGELTELFDSAGVGIGPERMPFPHDPSVCEFRFSADDIVRFGRTAFADGGVVFRHVLYSLSGDRFQCLAVYGLRSSRAYRNHGRDWMYVRPFPLAAKEAGRSAMRYYGHGVGLPHYPTRNAGDLGLVVLSVLGNGETGWVSML
jgi:hypothetical protein